MYLSTLLIDTGTNPDRPRPGRLWLRNLYHVHQRLCMAFPSTQRKDTDTEFLKPYAPADFPEDRFRADEKPAPPVEVLRHVHAKRNDQSGFLFRVDPLPGGRTMIVVLSALEPNWGYAFNNAMHLLAAIPDRPRPLRVNARAGERFRFRLMANAVFRATSKSRHRSGQPIEPGWIGKRIGVAGDEASLRRWIERRSQRAGFAVAGLTLAQPSYVYVNKTAQPGQGHRLRCVRYEGSLEVTNPDAFRQALISGIGPAKAFGFGLLSIAPVP